MVGSTCCVVNCGNTSSNSKCRFYKFPTASHKLVQREKWIAAVRRINSDGSQWLPKPHNAICSAHFVGDKKSEEQMSPSYVPSIFPLAYKRKKVNEVAAANRHKRFMNRRLAEKPLLKKTISAQPVVPEPMEITAGDTDNEVKVVKKFIDQECQVYIITGEERRSTDEFVCNRYIYVAVPNDFNDKTYIQRSDKSNIYRCDAEIQTTIAMRTKIVIPNQKKYKNKQCGTPQKKFVDQAVGPDWDTGIKDVGGIEDIEITKSMMLAAQSAYSFYDKYLKSLSLKNGEEIKKDRQRKSVTDFVAEKTR